jgi:hypothetical protein
VLEAPELIPDLAAWYDSRTDAYFALAGASVTAWMSRAGSYAAAPISQGTAANQPTRVLGAFGGKNSVLFDGTDFLTAPAPTPPKDWSFLHNSVTGGTVFQLLQADSTGAASQVAFATTGTVATTATGAYLHFGATAMLGRICNGGGAGYTNAAPPNNAALISRDVAKWFCWVYGAGFQRMHAAGGTATSQADTGSAASLLAPATPFRVGGSSAGSFKGHVPQVIVYERALAPAEITSLATWAVAEYGVAP